MRDKSKIRLNADKSGGCVKKVVSKNIHVYSPPLAKFEIDKKAAPVGRLANAGLPTIQDYSSDSSKDRSW